MQDMLIFLSQNIPEGRVFALDQQTLVQIGVQVLNGIILAVLLGIILYKPVKKFLDERSNKIKNKIDNSDSTMAKAQALIVEYESKVANIDKEYERVLEEARSEAVKEEDKILQEAREEANKIREESLESISREKDRIQQDARPYIIELATILAEKYVTVSLDKDEQERLFDEILSELEVSQWHK